MDFLLLTSIANKLIGWCYLVCIFYIAYDYNALLLLLIFLLRSCVLCEQEHAFKITNIKMYAKCV